VPRMNTINVNPDGSFNITGLPPGKLRLSLINYNSPAGFSLMRVERDGVAQPDGIEIQTGNQVTGVRVVLAYGSGVVRGQVNFEGGDRPAGVRFMVGIKNLSGNAVNPSRPAEIDARNHFVFEGLTPGDYELFIFAMPLPGSNGKLPPMQPGKQTVTVTNGAASEVTLVMDLTPKK